MKYRLNLYVISEILPPFLFGLLIFTFFLLITRILKLVELVVSRGVPMWQIAKVFSLLLPTFIELTIPMALLLGVLWGLGRLSSDQEVLALKASGISPAEIIQPIALVAIAASLMNLMITSWIRPAANLALKQELYSIAKTRVESAVTDNVFNNDLPNILLYVEETVAGGNAFQGVLIIDRRDRSRTAVIFAKAAFPLSNDESQSLSLKLFDGTIHEKKKATSGFSQTQFNVYDFKLDLEDAFSPIRKKGRQPNDMSLSRLINTIQAKREKGAKQTLELTELHQRFSFAFLPLVFSFLGASLAMHPTRLRPNRSLGFAVCLFWLGLYYGLLAIGRSLAVGENVSPALALWLPSVVIVVIATLFYRKAMKETPPRIQAKLQELFLGGRLAGLWRRGV